MTRTFCDGCLREINERQDHGWTFDVEVQSKDGNAFQFTGDLMLGSWRFNSTGKAFCSACVLKALKSAVSKLGLNEEGGAK